MDAGQALILQGDALHLPLPDESVDLVVTSPPYFALRAYDAGPAQIGSEPTPAEYLEALWAATAEMVRVLKPSGSIFVDLGDKYGGGVWPNTNGTKATTARSLERPKSLLLLPERYRIGCVDHLGLIARAVIVWQKPNGLPESVTDRVRRSHEDWVHLTKQPRYYSATDEVREPYSPEASGRRALYGQNARSIIYGATNGEADSVMGVGGAENPLGKLPGSVWTIPSEPLRLPEHLGVQHYAAFPSEWPRRLVLAFSPPGICLECGQGRVPVVERQAGASSGGPVGEKYEDVRTGGPMAGMPKYREQATILGYACSCTPFTDHPGSNGNRRSRDRQPMPGARPQGTYARKQACEYEASGPWREYHLDGWRAPPTRPAVVLDPFGGTGTVAMVARALDRIGLSFDLSMPYCRAARWRVHHDAGKAISRTNLERQGSLL